MQNVYQVSVYTDMNKKAFRIPQNLEIVLMIEYRPEVANKVKYTNRDEGKNINDNGGMSLTNNTLLLDTNNRYMNGSARILSKEWSSSRGQARH